MFVEQVLLDEDRKLNINRVDDDAAEANDRLAPSYVVGVGASAGGLEALEALFDALPPDTGMAFVVIQHLSPDFKSLMDELIRRHTKMAVFRVENGMQVQRNAIYLIPAGKEMIISEGCLLLTDKDPDETFTLPIDHFFRSLAQDCGNKAVAIVLSGSGSDGSRGVRDVHAAGGLVVTQDAATAAFDNMPNASDETGVVDITAAPYEIADALLRLVNHPLQRAAQTPDHPAVPEDGIKKILRVLRDAYGIDFTYYKPTTVMRRIERRLLLNRSTDLGNYVDTISEDSSELNLLYKDLLIGVTQFFRDMDAFKLIESEILGEALLRIPPDQEFRVWVAGCATGEEAYSLAILIHERLTAMNWPINVRIFATDVHRTSVDFASAGVYDDSSVSQLSSPRLERYFNKTQNGYKVCQDLRNMVVFAPHNLIKDAPFTRLDLISCRNLLIYLQPLAQKKALSLFHFALKTGGTLFLGPSETTGKLAEEFDVHDAQWRLYRKRRDIRLPPELRLPNTPVSAAASQRQAEMTRTAYPIRSITSRASVPDRELLGLYDALLDETMPPSLVVNESNVLVHSFGKVNDYLRVPVGRASSNALDLLPADLRTIVIGAMQRVSKSGTPATFNRVTVDTAHGKQEVAVTVKPIALRSNNAVYSLIVLESEDAARNSASNGAAQVRIDDVSRERIDVLEVELRHSRESLQATIEELESSNEELQATNEELVASNEELQSTNEELHSVNEELYTVNAEYQKKIGELTEMTHDMNNLFNCTDVHTLFLDEELCIRKFTPQMGVEFNLIPSDVGRRIEGFSHNIPCENLMDKLTQAITSGKRFEEEISTSDHAHFLLRILPYRGETNRSGVVLTLVDVTESRDAETRFRGTFENAAVGIAHVELDGRFVRSNQRLCEILGYEREELLKRSLHEITHAADQAQEIASFSALKRGDVDRYTLEERLISKDQQLVWTSLTVSLERDEKGTPTYAICVVQDISAQKTFESQLSDAVSQRDRFLAMLSHELRNPLNAIVNAACLLERVSEDIDDDPAQKARQVIRRQSNQVAALLNDLLDVSRVTQGKITLEPDICNLNELVAQSVETVDELIRTHGHKLTVETTPVPIWISADPARILQVIENLLTNAVKYTPSGGSIEVKTSTESQGSKRSNSATWAILEVVDSGLGMSPQLIESVFDMFVQSDETLDRSEGGMGVGLTLVRSLVELHGGGIEAVSEGLGKGSKFVVRLPTTSAPHRKNHELKPHIATTGPNRSVLLIEDNADTREMLCSLLELDGFEVTTASNGEEGLRKLCVLHPAIALIDIGLPNLNGYEIVQSYLRDSPESKTHLIAVTGYGQDCDVQRVKDAGFHQHLVKPINPNELTRLLAQATA